ncbi:MAG TPA: tetratricopeptide repeat protein [Acidobacteriaceae bacterium]|jgi:tetratricopeptide (TPR) repeat protein
MLKLSSLLNSAQSPEVIVHLCKKILPKIRNGHRYNLTQADRFGLPGESAEMTIRENSSCTDGKYGFWQFLAILAMLFPTALWSATTTSTGVVTNPLNLEPAVRQAYQQFYILDYDGALSQFEKVQALHPAEPLAIDYILYVTLFRELYRLDLLDTTFYAHDGFLTGKHKPTPADPAVQSKINQLAQQAIALANQHIKTDPKDVDAIFARGWARSLSALYAGLVNRAFVGALHQAIEARSDHEKVLQLSPQYVDAKLVVGVHQYVVGSLPFTFKLVAGIAGITGSKSKGISELEDAGNRGIITSVEARTALALFLRREANYKDGVVMMRSLCDEYPRDFLFCLEVANLTKDDGDGPKAIGEYRTLIRQAERPGYFPSAHLELAWFGLAEALRGQKDYQEAASAYDQAAAQPSVSAELRGRCVLNAGEMYDLLQERDRAQERYQAVVQNYADSNQADSARRYLKSRFTGP